MRYLIEPRDRIYVKGYGFCLLLKKSVKIWAINVVNIAKKSITNATKAASKIAIQQQQKQLVI